MKRLDLTICGVVCGVVCCVVAAGCDGDVSPDGRDALATGTAPNAVAVTTCDGRQQALVTASQGAALNVIDTESGARVDVKLATGSTPWDVALFAADRVVVTLFGADGVALVDPCAGAVLDAVRPTEPVIDLDTPITPRRAVDADGDGSDDAVVTRMQLRGPEAVVVDDEGRVFVTFTNIIDVAETGDAPMQAGPGVVARFAVEDDRLVLVEHRVLPCQNPQGAAVSGDVLVVSCTGTFRVGDRGLAQASPGGLVVFDTATLDERALLAADGTPSFGTPLVSRSEQGDRVIVGGVFGGVVFAYDLDSLDFIEDRAIAGDSESVFALFVDDDGEIVALRFLNGDMVADPFGTGRVFAVSPPGEPPRGLIDLAVDVDNGRGFALFSLSGELVPVALP